MKRLAVVLACVLALAVIAPAGAHNTGWYWNRYKAQYELLAYGLEWQDEFDEVFSARCYGFGKWIRLKQSGQGDRVFGFKHFRCKIWADDDELYWIVFHVTGRDSWDFRWLKWA